MPDWKDILTDDDTPLSEEELMLYINPGTAESEKKQIKNLAVDAFELDALEGLQQINNPGKTRKQLSAIKAELRQQLNPNKKRRNRKNTIQFKWIIVSVIIVLITCLLSYFVIHLLE